MKHKYKQVNKLAILIVSLLISASIQAQKFYELIKNLPPETKFSQVQSIVNQYFDNMPVKDNEYKQWKRYEYFAQRRVNDKGVLEDVTHMNKAALAKREIMKQQVPAASVNATHASWLPLGPTGSNNSNVNIGRVVCMAFHPTSANTFYVGAASGGLWKTTDGGNTWASLTDFFPSISISSIVVNPNNGNEVYIITGDGNGSGRSHYIRHYGTGVYKTTDGGTTWTETGMIWDLSSITFGYKLLMHPNTSTKLFAGTSTGFWRSTNSGANWARTLSTEQITDIEFKPGSQSHMFACGYTDNFYYSTDTGRTWTSRNLPATGVNRMEIGVTADNPNRIYLLCGPDGGNGIFKGLYTMNTVSSYGSATITTQSTTPNIFDGSTDGLGDGSQTWRNLTLYVSPTDEATVIGGSLKLWKNTSSGTTGNWTYAGTGIHADNHFILKHPSNNDLYSGCDGGIFKSTDGGINWTALTDGMQITQFYRFDASANTFGRFLAGAQDNAQLLRNGSNTYNVLSCCDGMDQAIDYTNHNIMYMCTQNGVLSKSTNGTDNNAAVTQPTAGDDYWVTNLNLHTATNTTVFFGGAGGIKRSTNSGSSWVILAQAVKTVWHKG